MIRWESDHRLVVGETSFELAVFLKGFTGEADFALQKTRGIVERYLDLRDEFHEANVVELGIFRGGSVALLVEALSPNKMVSIDIETERVAQLDEFVAARGLTKTIVPHYGVDQSDTAAIDEIVARHFGDAPLDLVIDDASHDRDLTLASFNALFWRLRPGGLYIVEDWSAELGWERLFRSDPERYKTELELIVSTPGLSPLLLDALLSIGYDDSIVAELTVVPGLAMLRRGVGEIDSTNFDLERIRETGSILERSRSEQTDRFAG